MKLATDPGRMTAYSGMILYFYVNRIGPINSLLAKRLPRYLESEIN